MAEVALRDYLNEIDSLIDHDSIEVAVQHCRHILQQYPKAVEVYRLLGKALLEREDEQAAQDVFQRVLSVDPEDFVARVGLSIVHDRNNEVDPAIWHMERAFDVAPSNALIQGELRRLYARRDGHAPERIPLTRDALARMYAQGDLNAEAVADLRQLLREQPDRIDLQVQMAEVLWRDEQRVEASELAQQITSTLPYCLKANLIMGAILHDSGSNGESDEPFRRAWAVDPENDFADRFFGGQGPLTSQPVLVDRLELQTVADRLEIPVLAGASEEEVPDWLRGISDLESPLLEEPERMPRLSAGVHMPATAPEIPDWLQGLTAEPAAAEAEVPDWLATLTGAAVAGAAAYALTDREDAEEALPDSAEQVPDWINQLGSTGTLTELAPSTVEDEQPAWLAQLAETPPAPFSETISSTEDTETPDWLSALAGAAIVGTAAHALTEQEATESPEVPSTADEAQAEPLESPEARVASEAEQPAWLAQFAETPPAPYSDTISAEADTETPDWLAALTGAAVPGTAAHALTEREDLETPAIQPVAESTPDTIDQLKSPGAFTPVEPLSPVVEEEQPDWMAQLTETAPVPYSETISAETDTETPDWLAQLSALGGEVPGEAEPAQAVSVVADQPEVPEEMPSADDALAFLAKLAAGKEDQLRAEAQQDADVRMAEIMGRKPAAPKPADVSFAVKAEEPAATAEAPTVPEEMPSADDALAFLAKLAAGKEDQLRAEAQQDADVRMAEIMGRKPTAPKPADVPFAVKVEEPAAMAEAPAVPEAMPSADDALAFLAKLAAGKEDQLRAEAQQDADVRMAEIMGRKPAAPKPVEPVSEEKPVIRLATTGAAAAGLVVAATKIKNKLEEPENPVGLEATSAPSPEVPEAMPSADDALAFLAKLSSGKEDQLRLQAEQEADVRMAAIMGRAKPVEPEATPAMTVEPSTQEETVDWLTDLAAPAVAEPVSTEELPDWLQQMRPPEESLAAEPASELPDWLSAMRPGESSGAQGLVALFADESEEEQGMAASAGESPVWLHSMESGESLEVSASEEEEAEPAASVSEIPDWLRSLQTSGAPAADEALSAEMGGEEAIVAEAEPTTEDLLAELAALQQAAVVVEAKPSPAGIALSPDWWAQSAEDTAEDPLQELPEPFVSQRARSAEKEKNRAASAVPAQKKPAASVSRPQSGPLTAPAPAAASPEVETLRARVSSDTQDHAARLDLARTYWATGNREAAYVEYLELASVGELTKEVTGDLESIIEIDDRPDWHRMLGDVYMKAGKSAPALAQYRLALHQL